MTLAIIPKDITRFRAIIEHRFGLKFDDDKRDFLANVMRVRLEKSGQTQEPYLAQLESGVAHDEWSALARLLTIQETYFFRHYDQFRAFAELALPERIRAYNGIGQMSILSAGCASGEEAYSLAIMVREAGADMKREISIIGADINSVGIDKGIRGHYSNWALRETPADKQQKWFQSIGRNYVLDESIRNMVQFEERNLAIDDPAFWYPASYDIIFCRNMMMYFSVEKAKALIGRIARALKPDGYLFLGHAETLRGLSHDFHLRHTHETFYYQRRSDHKARFAEETTTQTFSHLSLSLPSSIDSSETWIETIRRSTERIKTLADPVSIPQLALDSKKSQWNLTSVHSLLQQERFAEALQEIQALPLGAEKDIDVLLLKTVICLHNGGLEEAERLCGSVLEIDELNAGAQYVLALCREGVNDNQTAISHSQMATYLDPAFAMPRLHLGLLARRAGDLKSARCELEQALTLLKREDSSRLLLFGGGFGRDALMALCRAELTACGG